jgi:hypothetical protein
VLQTKRLTAKLTPLDATLTKGNYPLTTSSLPYTSVASAESAYDGFRHFVLSVGAKPDSLFAMFTLYCDDSGTHKGSDIAVAGCYISTVEQWEHFKRNWKEIDEREHFGVFHMADFVAKKKQFALPEWQDEDKRNRTIRALVSTIKIRAKIGFCAAIQKSAFEEVMTDDIRGRFGNNHYAFAIRLCTALVDQWRRKHGYTERVQYVFDRVSEGKGDIDAMFNIYASGGTDALHRYGIFEDCWSFQNKADVVQLQAADIWAYESFRYMRDCLIPEKLHGIKTKPRGSYTALRGSPIVVRYHLKHSLEELVRRTRSFIQEKKAAGGNAN